MTVHSTPKARKPRAILTWLSACALALCALPMLSACSEENSTPAPTQSASPSPSATTTQGTWTAGKNASDWGTYSLASDTFGNFSIDLPSQPSEEIGEDGSLKLIVDGETPTGAQYMLLVDPLDDSEFQALTPMSEQEREEQLYWYAADFVGAEAFVENMQAASYEGRAGVRYQASNFHADIWTILDMGESGGYVYSLCAYSSGNETTPSELENAQRFMESFRLIMM